MNAEKLLDLSVALNDSASSEGCSDDLLVVDRKALWDVLQFLRSMRNSMVNISDRMANISDRLVDSESFAGDSAVPEVAEEAAEMLGQLATLISANSAELAQLKVVSEKNRAFVDRVAELSLWDWDDNDGNPQEECETPSDGYEDSHNALMGLIEDARKLKTGEM